MENNKMTNHDQPATHREADAIRADQITVKPVPIEAFSKPRAGMNRRLARQVRFAPHTLLIQRHQPGTEGAGVTGAPATHREAAMALCGPVTIFDVADDGTLSNPVRADVMMFRGDDGRGRLQQVR